jgi:hypothetical protein
MGYWVKVIPPSSRARIHDGECVHCRNGQGQENQDKGGGPTRWEGPFATVAQARTFMASLHYRDTDVCRHCNP